MEQNQSVLQWFESFKKTDQYQTLQKHPIAYFCAEYALSSEMPIYAGGLGVLAGDFVRQAADSDIPVVAVGLYYQDGYETLHDVDGRGYIDVPHVHPSPENFGLSPLLDESGNRVIIEVFIQDRLVKMQVWRWQIKNVAVFLLDTQIEDNAELDKKITDHLYVVDKETRLKQEIVLGIGGYKLLKKLQILPSVYHMNEGHSALLSLEIICDEMEEHKVSFEEAKNAIAKKIVFTNHTLLVSGNDVFSNDLVSLLLSTYAKKNGIPIENIINLGLIQESSSFSMTMLALRVAGKINAVSKLHAIKAKDTWHDHTMIPIVNGIHIPTWNTVGDEEHIWQSHQENKKELLRKLNMFSSIEWREDELLIGWARRFVEYKRPLAVFEDLERLHSLLTAEKKVHMVFAGRLHPSDEIGNNIREKLRDYSENVLKGSIVFLPEYNLENARLLVAGCDVWLNTPIVGFEACGTSGMKAALNGNLPCTTRDGWVYEADISKCGWILDSQNISRSIYSTIENEIAPIYYKKNTEGVSNEWVEKMKQARMLVKNQFSAQRMLKNYIEQMYEA